MCLPIINLAYHIIINMKPKLHVIIYIYINYKLYLD